MVDINQSQWSETDANCNAASPNGWNQSQSPSSVADCGQMVMGAVKRFYDHINPTVTATGSSNAFSISYTVAPTSIVVGDRFTFISNQSVTGASTLNINSLTSGYTIVRPDGTSTQTGDIVNGAVVDVVYIGSSKFQLVAPNVNTVSGEGGITSLTSGSGITLSPSTITTTGSISVGTNSITNALLAQVSGNTLKGNNTGSTANVADLTATQVTAMLVPFVGSGSSHAQGLVPDPGSTAGTTRYLREDSTWVAPPTYVTNVSTGTGLTGGPISSTGTISLANTAVTAGTYSNPTLAINSQGQVTSASNGTALPGVRGLKITVTSNTGITVSANYAILLNSSGNPYWASSVSVTIATNTTGANGLDTGAIGNSTWYYLFLISNGTTVAGLISASATSPTLPSGYTYSYRVGAVRTDSSGNLLRTMQIGNAVQYIVTTSTNTAALPEITSGTAGTFSSTITWASVAIGNFVPPVAVQIRGVIQIINANESGCAVSPNNAYGGYNTSANPPYVMTPINTSSNLYIAVPFEFMLESTNIYYASSSAVAYVFCAGWEDSI